MRNNKLIIVTVVLVILFAASVVCVNGCSQQAKNEEIKASIKRNAEDAYNNGNVDALDEHCVQDYIRHVPPEPDVIGLDAFKEGIKNTRLRLPDCRLTIGKITIDGNYGSIQWTFQGTYSGQTPDTASLAGKRINTTGCTMIRLESGKLVEEWRYGDDLGRQQQLGYIVMPPLTETTFARVTLTQGKPDKMNDTIKLYKDSAVPAAKSQKGYRGIILLSDFEKGKGISISLWDSEEDAIANEQSGYYQEQVDKFKDFFTAKPIREGYVVTVQE